jgi:hypothetical protein
MFSEQTNEFVYLQIVRHAALKANKNTLDYFRLPQWKVWVAAYNVPDHECR